MSEQEINTQAPADSADQQSDSAYETTGPTHSRPAAAPAQAASLLMGVKLPIRVLLGRTQLCLRDIAQLGNGAVVELDCSPDDPVAIIVNGRVIAHGEVVVVSGNYGVRITKIGSRREDVEEEGLPGDLFSFSQKLR
jgi:flagellar motor switch protein FliN